MEITEVCAICQDIPRNYVKMSCSHMHKLCFECLLKHIEVKKSMKSCIACTCAINCVIIDRTLDRTLDRTNDPSGIYSLDYFIKCIPFISKALKTNLNEVCLVYENDLLFYINNKTQLEMACKMLASNFELDNVVETIKWNFGGSISGNPRTRIAHGGIRTQGLFGQPIEISNDDINTFITYMLGTTGLGPTPSSGTRPSSGPNSGTSDTDFNYATYRFN